MQEIVFSADKVRSFEVACKPSIFELLSESSIVFIDPMAFEMPIDIPYPPTPLPCSEILQLSKARQTSPPNWQAC